MAKSNELVIGVDAETLEVIKCLANERGISVEEMAKALFLESVENSHRKAS